LAIAGVFIVCIAINNIANNLANKVLNGVFKYNFLNINIGW
jgi:hypothetical protein